MVKSSKKMELGRAPEGESGGGGQARKQAKQGAVHLVQLAAQHDVAQLRAAAGCTHLPKLRPCAQQSLKHALLSAGKHTGNIRKRGALGHGKEERVLWHKQA